MRLRNPLIALAVLAGLTVYVYFVEIRGGEKSRKAKEASEHLLSVPAEEVSELVLTHGGSPVRLVRQAGAWKIVEPVPADPEADAATRLLQAVNDLRISRNLGKVPDLKPYNLAAPPVRLVIRFLKAKPEQKVILGDDAPTGGGIYARPGDAGPVVVVTGAEPIRSATLFSLRDKTFLKFDPGRLTALKLERGKEEIDLSRVGGKWRLTAPVLAPGDDGTISDLVYALERLTVTEFLEAHPGKASLSTRGLDPPRIRVLLSGEEWPGEKEMAFGNGASGSISALRPGTGELIQVSDSVDSKLKSGAEALRKKDLLPFSRYQISRVRITGIEPGPLALEEKKEGGWRRTEPSPADLDEDSVDLLLRNLTDLKADGYLDRPEGDLSRLGLVKPTMRLEFWEKDKKEGAPAALEIGREDGKGKVAMKDSSWPSVLMVDATAWRTASAQATKVARETGKAVAKSSPASSPAPSMAPSARTPRR